MLSPAAGSAAGRDVALRFRVTDLVALEGCEQVPQSNLPQQDFPVAARWGGLSAA